MGERLGKRLVELRKQNGMTQDEAVRKSEQICKVSNYPESSKISRSALANYEKGIRVPNNLKLRLLAEMYDASYEELTGTAAVDLAMEKVGDTVIGAAPGVELMPDKMEKSKKKLSEPDNRLSDDPDEKTGNRAETTDIPLRIHKNAHVGEIGADELALIYCSRDELVLLEKIKRLNTENRNKIESRLDMLLDMQ